MGQKDGGYRRLGRVDEVALAHGVSIGIELGRANLADASVASFVITPVHSTLYALQDRGPADACRCALAVYVVEQSGGVKSRAREAGKERRQKDEKQD